MFDNSGKNTPIDFLFAIYRPRHREPPVGPALILATVRRHGYKSRLIDLNMDLYLRLKGMEEIEQDFFSGRIFNNPARYSKVYTELFSPVKRVGPNDRERQSQMAWAFDVDLSMRSIRKRFPLTRPISSSRCEYCDWRRLRR